MTDTKAKDTERVMLTQHQVTILGEIRQRMVAAEREWVTALLLAGIDPKRVLRGDLKEGYFDLKPEE